MDFHVTSLIYDPAYKFSRNEKAFLMALLAKRTAQGGNDDWFSLSNEILQEMTGLAKNTLRTMRRSLADRGFIEFKYGALGKKTEYKINISAFVHTSIC